MKEGFITLTKIDGLTMVIDINSIVSAESMMDDKTKCFYTHVYYTICGDTHGLAKVVDNPIDIIKRIGGIQRRAK